jgi:hypothetical protein
MKTKDKRNQIRREGEREREIDHKTMIRTKELIMF